MRPTRLCLVLAAIAASVAGFSLTVPAAIGRAEPNNLPLHMDPASWVTTRATQSAESMRERHISSPKSGDQAYYVLHVEFQDAASCKAFKVPGATPFAHFDRFATMFVAQGDDKTVDAMDRAPGVVWIDLDDLAHAPPPPRVEVIRERGRNPDRIVRGGLNGLTGKGVLLAVVDTGIDFRNSEFITEVNGKPVSRLLYYWDTLDGSFDLSGGRTGSRPPIAYPNKSSIGTMYTRDQLNMELQAAAPLKAEPDAEGHGTACAAVAAGNGRSSEGKFTGVAPGVDLIGVRVAQGSAMENGFLLGAVCDWLNQIATNTGRPLVISCSFCSQDGGHDGCRVEERELDARFPATAKGRVICFAAGNEEEDGLHSRVEFGRSQKTQELNWCGVKPTGRRGPKTAEMALYVDGAAPEDIDATGDGLKVTARYVHPLSKSTVLKLELPADGKLQLTCKSKRAAIADAYVWGVGGDVRFPAQLDAKGQLVGSPGLAGTSITVGSYDFNDGFATRDGLGRLPIHAGGKDIEMEVGAISAYSSRGYSRRGDTKPDLVAPGQYFIVPAVLRTPQWARDTTGKFAYFNGTSAATPYVAGIIALMLEKKPDLTLGQVKDLLHKNMTDDKFVGSAPNETWGYGKLNYKAVEKVLAAVEK